jgi:hypothetical protein
MKLMEAVRKVVLVGGWAPLVVFSTHVFLSRGLNAYRHWPPTDIPMHFAGGLAMAYFISRCFRELPREITRSHRVSILELLLIGSLTTSAAVVWEFVEFTCDRIFESNVQVSLANTMQDMALGMAGAAVVVAARARQLRAGRAALVAVAGDWIRGRAA